MVATTVVAFDVRPGNPKHIANWNDLTQSGLQILTPDPSQSGGAKWNIVGAYGASMRGKVTGYAENNAADAEKLLQGIFTNVTVMDKSANDSLKNFQSGNGDVAISYENQILLSKAGGKEDELVVPPSTVLIQNPTVVVDRNAEKHCVENVANAFVSFLHTPDAQEIFQTVGYFRPVDPTEAQKGDQRPGTESGHGPVHHRRPWWLGRHAGRHGVRPGRGVHQGAGRGTGLDERTDHRPHAGSSAPGIAGRGAPASPARRVRGTVRPSWGGVPLPGHHGGAAAVRGDHQGVQRRHGLADGRVRTDRGPPGTDPHDRDGGPGGRHQRGLRDDHRLRPHAVPVLGPQDALDGRGHPVRHPHARHRRHAPRALRARTRRWARSWRATA